MFGLQFRNIRTFCLCLISSRVSADGAACRTPHQSESIAVFQFSPRLRMLFQERLAGEASREGTMPGFRCAYGQLNRRVIRKGGRETVYVRCPPAYVRHA
ncbi:hypothetical protein NDU88_005009 [Pleurodeles waltl]|uniref:Secreted protein n=1 Tax=Pleurodeles waltl TaxID=8319 RepID=A0AAV7QJT8_PLEWA|nr:hypothetical protein NDU88_005009 [Pleurodeles waltl]